MNKDIKQILETVGLLSSMVTGGEKHSQQSKNSAKLAQMALHNIEREVEYTDKLKRLIEIIPGDYEPQEGDIGYPIHSSPLYPAIFNLVEWVDKDGRAIVDEVKVTRLNKNFKHAIYESEVQ